MRLSLLFLFSLLLAILLQETSLESQQLDDKLFVGVERQTAEIDGVKFRSPVEYRDSFQMSASFEVPVVGVKALLPSSDLHLVLVKPNTTILIMGAMEFRQPEVMAPYKQFTVLLPVFFCKKKQPGLYGHYIVYLPVTTEQAKNSGIRFYGLPKFLAEVAFSEDKETRRCQVRADGKEIISFAVKKLPCQLQTMQNYCYSAKAGHLYRYRIKSRGYWQISQQCGGAEYKLGDHPIAAKLKELNIGKISLNHFYAAKMQSLVYLPEDIGTLPQTSQGF